ncbi:hypothetical protein Tco_1110514 [Tanacetum coccineum]|uniref:Uncharacterized protein n=1 Tax=Tanacetum coccineum TaxID=301880 RepID=A0ABQ5IJ10_9ASTR
MACEYKHLGEEKKWRSLARRKIFVGRRKDKEFDRFESLNVAKAQGGSPRKQPNSISPLMASLSGEYPSATLLNVFAGQDVTKPHGNEASFMVKKVFNSNEYMEASCYAVLVLQIERKGCRRAYPQGLSMAGWQMFDCLEAIFPLWRMIEILLARDHP